MNAVNKMVCPVCKAELLFDVYGLLSGKVYSCPNCSAALSLASESYGVLEDTMKKYESLKRSGGRANEAE